MIVTHAFLPLDQFAGDREGPRVVIPRETREEVWLLPSEPLSFDRSVQFRQSAAGDGVMIPLMRTQAPRDVAGKAAFFASLGTTVRLSVPHDELLRLHVVVGLPITEHPTHDEVWIGLALRTK